MDLITVEMVVTVDHQSVSKRKIMANYDARSQPVNQVTIYESQYVPTTGLYWMTWNTIQKNYSIFRNSVPPNSVFHIGTQWSSPPNNWLSDGRLATVTPGWRGRLLFPSTCSVHYKIVGHPMPILWNGAWYSPCTRLRNGEVFSPTIWHTPVIPSNRFY